MGGDQSDDQNDDQNDGRLGHRGAGDSGVGDSGAGDSATPVALESSGRRALPWTDPPEPDVSSPDTGADPAPSYIDDESADDGRFEPL